MTLAFVRINKAHDKNTRQKDISPRDIKIIFDGIALYFPNNRPIIYKKFVPDLLKYYKYFLLHITDFEFMMELHDTVHTIIWNYQDDYIQSQIDISENIEKYAIRWYQALCKENKIEPINVDNNKTDSKTIVYLLKHASISASYACSKLIYSCLHGHSSNRNIVVYIHGGSEIEFIDSLSHKVTFKQFSGTRDSTFRKIRNEIMIDKPYMVISELKLSLIAALFSARIAPKQVYWSMGFSAISWADEYVLLTSDYHVKHLLQLSGKKCIEMPYRLHRTLLAPEENKANTKEIRRQLNVSPDQMLIGYLGRMEKVNDEYLDLICTLLWNNKIKYFCAGPGDVNRIENHLKSRAPEGQYTVSTSINPHEYGYAFDLFIETFPMGTGLSAIEVMAKGIPVVYLKTKSQKGMQETTRVPSLGAENTDELIGIILALLSKPQLYKEASKACKNIVKNMSRCEDAAAIIESIAVNA